MFPKLLRKIHDPNVGVNRIINAFQATVGESTVRSIIGAGLIHMQQLCDINAKDILSRIQASNLENKNKTHGNSTNIASVQVDSFLPVHRVLNNKDLCCRIVSHCNGQEINGRIMLINRYFNDICRNPQTYSQLRYSKSTVVKKTWCGDSNSKKTNIKEITWSHQSRSVLLRYRHCSNINIDIQGDGGWGEHFYTLKNVTVFEKFTRIKQLWLDCICESAIGDKFFAILDKLFVTNNHAPAMAGNIELLHIDNVLSSNYINKLRSLINRATFSSLVKINVRMDQFAAIFEAVTTKDIPNTYRDAAMYESNSSLLSGSFPKLNDISIHVDTGHDNHCSWYTSERTEMVVDCTHKRDYRESDKTCEQCLSFWNSWYKMTNNNVKKSKYGSCNRKYNHKIWMQIRKLDLKFKYCKNCLPKLFDKIYVIGSNLINVETLDLHKNWQLPEWFLFHFIYAIIQSQLQYHKCVKLKCIHCCQISDDISYINTNFKSITAAVTEYKKLLPKLLAPHLQKLTISCSEISDIPESLFIHRLESGSYSNVEELNINFIENDAYHEGNAKFDIVDIVDRAFENVSYNHLHQMIWRGQSDLQNGPKFFQSMNKYLMIIYQRNPEQKIKILIDFEVFENFFFLLDKYHREQLLGFEKKYMSYFATLLALIAGGIDNGSVIRSFHGSLKFTGTDSDRHTILKCSSLVWCSWLLENVAHRSINAENPNLNLFYFFSFDSAPYEPENQILQFNISSNAF